MAEGERTRHPRRLGGTPPPRPLLLLLLLLAPPDAPALKVEDVLVQLQFFQESFPSGTTKKESGEFMFEFDGEEILHVDWDQKEAVWRLPDFTRFTSFEAQGGMGQMAVMKANLGVMMARTNRSREQNVAPSATVYPKDPVELGEPNVLVCFVDQFFPPVLTISWLKNGEGVSTGVQETDFYPGADFTFRKFSYLTFIPQEGDVYTCHVEHWGVPEGLTRVWRSKEPTPLPETTENVLCGLGLALGILGIVTGTVFFFKAMRLGERGL